MTLLTDTRFGLRLLKRNPGFAATVLAILVVGIGATTAVFSLLFGLVFRPLPYASPDELAEIETTLAGHGAAISIPTFFHWKEHAATFGSMVAVDYDGFSLGGESGPPLFVPGANVTGEFFATFGLPATRGRLLGPDDDRAGAPRTCVISAGLWQRRFASDPAIVGTAIVLNGESHTVVGIGPENFRFAKPRGRGVDIWVPIATTKQWQESIDDRSNGYLTVFGRRRLGASIAAAQSELTAIELELAERFPKHYVGYQVTVQDLRRAMLGSMSGSVWILFGCVGLVFLVACTNVANLLLARALSRRAEMAARAALGATPARLGLQIVIETLLLFALGAAGGALLSRTLVDWFASELVRGGATNIDVRVDWTTLAFANLVALLFGLVAGLVPAFEAARTEPQRILQEGGARGTLGARSRSTRSVLVVVQVAMAFALLVGSGLALRGFVRLASAPTGFDVEGVVMGRFNLPEAKSDDDHVRVFQQHLLERVAREPGVASAAITSSPPMGGSHWRSSLVIEGAPPWPPGARPHVEWACVSPGYFATLAIPVLRGRAFTDADVASGRRVTVISQDLAEKFFADGDPIGRRIAHGREKYEIVGVVGRVRHWSLADPTTPLVYVPNAQIPSSYSALLVRTATPELVLAALPRMIADVDPQQSVSSRARLADAVRDSIGEQRFVATLLAAFAAAALFLATFGIFGLVSYTTAQRTRELGIRLALGASPQDLVGLVMRHGVRLVALGLALGALGAIAIGRVIASRIVETSAFDSVVMLVIFGLLGGSGVLASLLPALRAARIPPATALRYEA